MYVYHIKIIQTEVITSTSQCVLVIPKIVSFITNIIVNFPENRLKIFKNSQRKTFNFLGRAR